MNAARSLPPISALLAAAPFPSGDRECEPFVVPAAGARNLLPASAEFSTRSALFAVGGALPTARRLVGTTIGHIGVDRRAKIPVAPAAARGLAQSGFNEVAPQRPLSALRPRDLTETSGLSRG
jgi:hypothetical protein